MSRLDPLIDRFPKTSSLVLGALAATGFPPLSWWPLALVAMGLAMRLVWRSADWRGATMRGWLFGVAHFTTTNTWIATSFTHQSEMPTFLGWLAVPLISLYLAIYPTLAAGGAKAFTRTERRPWIFMLAFAGLWIVTEWLRAWLFTGYAWGPFSLVLVGTAEQPGLALLLPWFGSYALSGVAVLASGLFVWMALARRYLAGAGLAAAITAGMLVPRPAPIEGSRPYLVVQPDLDQGELHDPREYEAAFVTLAELSVRKVGDPGGEDAKRLVFWPESGLPDYLREGYPAKYYRATTAGGDPAYAKRRLGAILGANTVLMTGAVDLEIEADKAIGAYNVVTAVDETGAIVGSYRKAHLVPFGEYLPLRGLLEPLGLSRLVAGNIDFLDGPGPDTVDVDKFGRVGMQICYEIVFSGEVVDREDRPDFLFNPSNDGWFGAWGPPQHFAQARMRAIEEGLPVIRATTTGISGVIDANGVVRASLGTGIEGRLAGLIPPAKERTLFALLGNKLALAWAVLFLVLSVVAMRWRRS
ncbi:MAG: apolipoprotein N-acyltransferase [Sphingomonas sp.]|nr:apolipoprotein N-acyltransferase [Sphingomonas sp.]